MKQQLSALMDGELCDDEADALLNSIRKDEDSQFDWQTFHLIGDVMRQPEHLPRDIDQSFFDRLAAEPTILAPQPRRYSRMQYFAMSAVASIMAMAFLAWFAMHIDSRPDPRMQQLARESLLSTPVAASVDTDSIDDYLLAHHEYSPSTELRGASSYIRTVAVRH